MEITKAPIQLSNNLGKKLFWALLLPRTKALTSVASICTPNSHFHLNQSLRPGQGSSFAQQAKRVFPSPIPPTPSPPALVLKVPDLRVGGQHLGCTSRKWNAVDGVWVSNRITGTLLKSREVKFLELKVDVPGVREPRKHWAASRAEKTWRVESTLPVTHNSPT